MKFNNLSHEEKLDLQKKVIDCMETIGGRNHFLGMIESIKEAQQHPLINKTAKCHYKTGTISWSKPIYKEKVIALKNMFIQHNDNNILTIKNEKLQKDIKNTIKTLSNVEFVIKTNDNKEYKFTPFHTVDDKEILVDPIFQILFFDSINNTKKILDY